MARKQKAEFGGVIEVFEGYMNMRQLHEVLGPLIPGCKSRSAFAALVPYLPSITLPGGKRRYFRLSEVYGALRERFGTVPKPWPAPTSNQSPRRTA